MRVGKLVWGIGEECSEENKRASWQAKRVHKEQDELICKYKNALQLTTMHSVGLLECFPVA